jgi:hypothetical protein
MILTCYTSIYNEPHKIAKLPIVKLQHQEFQEPHIICQVATCFTPQNRNTKHFQQSILPLVQMNFFLLIQTVT